MPDEGLLAGLNDAGSSPASPHDETVKSLLRQNQLAQFGGLQTVSGTVVHDGHRLFAAQQQLAVHAQVVCQNRMTDRTVCQYGLLNRSAACAWEG